MEHLQEEIMKELEDSYNQSRTNKQPNRHRDNEGIAEDEDQDDLLVPNPNHQSWGDDEEEEDQDDLLNPNPNHERPPSSEEEETSSEDDETNE
jgi:hypothetical protein